MTELEKAHRAFVAATDALQLVRSAQATAEHEAQKLVWARFSERIKEAHEAWMAADKAYRWAKVAGAYHPWVGKKVCRTVERLSYRNTVRDAKTVYGVIEICTPSSRFPEGTASWRLPQPGAAFVRLLKKDGTPGLGFATDVNDWKLVEKIDE
jgi:hypothetical protein